MTTLIIGSTRLAADVVMAFEHGDPDYVWLITEGIPGEADRVVVDHHPEVRSLWALFRRYDVDAVINAAEPYAEDLSANIASAAALARLPLLRAVPPSFETNAGSSRWRWVASFDAAGRVAAACPGEVLVALNPLWLAGRLGDLGGRSAFVHRKRLSTDPPLPGWAQEPERHRSGAGGASVFIDDWNVSLLVTADSGDTDVGQYVAVAEQHGLDVVIVRRPESTTVRDHQDSPTAPTAPTAPVVTDALSALKWLNRVRLAGTPT